MESGEWNGDTGDTPDSCGILRRLQWRCLRPEAASLHP